MKVKEGPEGDRGRDMRVQDTEGLSRDVRDEGCTSRVLRGQGRDGGRQAATSNL